MKSFSDLKLESDFRNLPADFYQNVLPQGLSKPQLVVVSKACADELDISLSSLNSPESLSILSGNSNLPNTRPLAMKYTGINLATTIQTWVMAEDCC